MDKYVNLNKVAKITPGMSGADLSNLTNEAALIAARNNRNKVIMGDFESAQEKILIGSERSNIGPPTALMSRVFP